MSLKAKRFFSSFLFSFSIILISVLLPWWDMGLEKVQIPTDDGKSSVVVTIVKKAERKLEKIEKIEKPKETIKKEVANQVAKTENSIKKFSEKKEEKIVETIENPVIENENLKADENSTQEEVPSNSQTESKTEENESFENSLAENKIKIEEDYKQYALKRIASKKVYPLSARTKSQEGKVRIHAIIDFDGKLILAEIISPCDFEILNEAALNAIKKSAPFKKMNNSKRNLDFTFTMDFSLK